MYILGISCFYHDSAAALLKDGILVAAAQEERFSRIKHDESFPKQAIQFCLNEAGISASDLAYVVFYEKPLLKFERVLLTTLRGWPKSWRAFTESMITWLGDKLWIRSQLEEELEIPSERILFTEHHLAHAASAFFPSSFEEAAVLTVDGVGEWATTTLGLGSSTEVGNALSILKEQRFPHSLGLLYSAFTAFLGFRVNNGEYKVMGMAPYGTPTYVDKIHQLCEIRPDGSFALNMDYFSFHHSMTNTFSPKFVELFGQPRVPDSDFAFDDGHGEKGSIGSAVQPSLAESQRYADIAASIQRVTEDAVLSIARHLHEETGSKNLCMAGGVALNSVANGRLLREGPFERLYVQPAAGDSGAALGAALYAHHMLEQKPRQFVMEHCYWGQSFSDQEVEDFLTESGISYEAIPQDGVAERVATEIAAGRIIGWFQGRFEWGPRALGNRSILADPRSAEIKEIVNSKIKFRELFRPFAPVVLDERASEYFQFPDDTVPETTRFMLLVVPVKPEMHDVIPAVTHLGTARCQTVRRENNPIYYDLIASFGEKTGVPVLLNTSFNLRGEPIVSSPADAYRTFCQSEIDLLVLNRYLIYRSDIPDGAQH